MPPMASDPQVGWWYYFCCEEDLRQIETEEELKTVLKERADSQLDSPSYCALFYSILPTRDEALAHIKRRREPYNAP